MNKKTLAKFFVVYLSVFTFFVVIGIIFKITQFDNYKTHNAKLWTEKNYLSNNLLKQNSLYASKEGRVYAWNLVPDQVPSWIPGSNQMNAAITIYECASSNQGFVECSLTSSLDTAPKPFIGGTFSDCKQTFSELSGGQVPKVSEKCDLSKSTLGALIESDNREVTPQQLNQGEGNIVALLNMVSMQAAIETDNIANIAYYNREIVKEIPLVGPQIAQAAWWDGVLPYISLGPSFFELWKASRNMTYFLIIIPTIAFGFAIMFKMQVGPQTQITLMKALPRLLITIIFITFSYPLIALLIQLAKPAADVGVALVWSFANGTLSGIDTIPWTEIGYIVGLIGNVLALAAGALAFGGWPLLLFFLIFVIAILIAIVRYVAAVYVNAIKLGFLIGFGPLIILVSAFPGREGILKNYFLNVSAKIFGLSVISIMFSMAWAVAAIAPVMGGPVVMFILFGTSLGILWKAPSAPKLLATAIGAQPLFEDITGGGQAGGKKR